MCNDMADKVIKGCEYKKIKGKTTDSITKLDLKSDTITEGNTFRYFPI